YGTASGPATTAPGTSIVDTEELPDGVDFTYVVKAKFGTAANAPTGPKSDPATVKAKNLPPAANPLPAVDDYSTDKELIVGSPGILGNDTDADTRPLTGTGRKLRAVIVTPPPVSQGVLTLTLDAYGSFNGGFTFTPASGFA